MSGTPVAVVLGASKGIGLAICEALKERGSTVMATCRASTEELKALNLEVLEGVDITDEAALEPLIASLRGRSIGILVVAAGYQELDTIDTVTREGARKQFDINALGPLFAVKALRGHLQTDGKVALISSKNGSVTEVDNTLGDLYGYRMSKVALNIAGATLARDLKPAGVAVALIHPGVVNTNMLRSLRKARGVPDDKLTANTLEPKASAQKIMDLLDKLSLENSGTFWAADSGAVVGW